MDLFRRYNRTILWTYCALVAVSFALYFLQFRGAYQGRIALFQQQVRERALVLDNLLKATTDHVNALEHHTRLFWQWRAFHPQPAPLRAQLRQLGPLYHLDQLPEPWMQGQVGNLSGEGELESLDEKLRQEIDMALHLNPSFAATAGNIPNAAWVYYTSRNRFIHIFPWVPSGDFHFTPELYTHEFFFKGTPEHNPERALFWTPAYVDEAGKGLMVTCAKPVYREEEFTGTVAIDLTLDFLNSVVSGFEAELGSIHIVNDHDQLIAHNGLVRSSAGKVLPASAALPAGLAGEGERLWHQRFPLQPFRRGGQLLFYQNLRLAPWRVVFIGSHRALLWSLLTRSGYEFIILLVGLSIMLDIANRINRRLFIRPAQALVNHIEAQNRREALIPPAVPEEWQPWFDTISRIFEENHRLVEQLKQHGETLDAQVRERTAELHAKNEELQATLDQLHLMKEKIVTQEKMASLGNLTAGIAHEIKNPLNFVNSFAKLNERLCRELGQLIAERYSALKDADRDELQELLADLGENSRKILQHGERADRIVVGMLQHSRGGGGEFAPADLNKMAEEFSHLAYHGLRANRPDLQVALEFKLDSGLAPFDMVASDLSRVILNIVNNACFAAADRCRSEPGHQPKVTVQSEDLGARVRLSVRDNGLGMPAEIQKRIFEPFFTTKPTGSGTGLGLSISYDIVVKVHRGELEVQSEPGVGTLFSILLPKQQKG